MFSAKCLLLLYLMLPIIIVRYTLQMNQSDSGNLFKNQSTKSLMKYRSEDIEKRALRIGKELLIPNARKKQQKNVFTITANTSNFSHKSQQPKSQQALKQRVRMLEYELKKKLQEDSLLKNLFRTKQTHEMNHIDLYLQLRALEDKYKEIVSEEEKSRQMAKECQQEMEEQEQFHMKNIEKIGEELSIKEEQWFSQKISLKEQIQRYKMQTEDNKFLIQELQKKNNELSLKNRQLVEQMQVERNTENLKFIKYKSEKTSQIESIKLKLQEKEDDLKQINEEKQQLLSEIEQQKEQVERLTDQNEKLELKVRELEAHFQDMSHNESLSKKEEKQKWQKTLKQYEDQMKKLMEEHELIMNKEKTRYETELNQMEMKHKNQMKQNKSNWKLEVEYLIKEHQSNLKKEKDQIFALKQQLTQIYAQKQAKEDAKRNIELQLNEVKQKMQMKESEMTNLTNDLSQERQINGKLTRQIKDLHFEKQQLSLRIDRLKFQVSDQLNFSQRLQSQLKYHKEQFQQLSLHNELRRVKQQNEQLLKRQLCSVKQQNNQLLQRCQELKKAVEVSHQNNINANNYLLLNQRNYNNENYNNQNTAGLKIHTESDHTSTGRVKQFSRDSRERMATRYSSKRKQKDTRQDRREELRSEVEKKYFR